MNDEKSMAIETSYERCRALISVLNNDETCCTSVTDAPCLEWSDRATLLAMLEEEYRGLGRLIGTVQ